MRLSFAISLSCLVLIPGLVQADWVRFRGPNGTGISHDEVAYPTQWSPSDVKWKVALPGPGSSSPIVVGDKIFVTCWTGYGTDRSDPGDQRDLRRHLLCLDRKTGGTIWTRVVEPVLPEDEYGGMFAEHGYATHTPVSDGERVFAFFGKSGVVAFDMEGNQLWQRGVGTESGAMNWGSASSPILYENLVIVPATAESEALVALNKLTGEVVWKQEAAGFSATWGSPILVSSEGNRAELVMAVPGEIWAIDPETGKLTWYCEGVNTNSLCSSAVSDDNGVVYAIESGPGGGGGVAVRPGGKGDVTASHVVWTGRQSNRIGTPLVHDDKIYSISNNVATYWDAATGKELDRVRLQPGASTSGAAAGDAAQEEAQPERPPGAPGENRGGRGGGRGGRGGRGGGGQDYGSPILAGGNLYYTTRGGETFVLELGDKVRQISANRVTTDAEDFSATPAVSHGELFLRSNKYLYCVSQK